MRVRCERLANVFEGDAGEPCVKARDGVTRGLEEAGAGETARDVQLRVHGLVVC